MLITMRCSIEVRIYVSINLTNQKAGYALETKLLGK